MRRYNFVLREKILLLRKCKPNASLSEIAEEVGVSKQRVFQILQTPLPDFLMKRELRKIDRAIRKARREVEKAVA